jgi:hypothetical protein
VLILQIVAIDKSPEKAENGTLINVKKNLFIKAFA